MISKAILVSICCVTYNHEKHIIKCLDGFVMQKTDFAFEILVHEDASTDSTAQILREYEIKYPELFKCVYQTENQFLKQNTLVNILFKMAKGKYLALCEGDDYWSDPYKLQKQVDFMEQNIDYSMCFHNATESLNSMLIKETYGAHINKQILSLEDFMFKHIVPTASILFRNNIDFPDWTNKVTSGDKLIVFLNATRGKIYYMYEVMSHYNVNDEGVSRSLDHKGLNKVYNMAYLLVKFDEYTNFEYTDILKKGLQYEIGVHILDPYRKELKTKLLIKEIFTRILIKYFKYKRKS